MNTKSFMTALLAGMALSLPLHTQTQAPLKRTPIDTHEVAPAKLVSNVQIVRLDFKPGQSTGRHMHPVPVITYVLEGEIVMGVEGESGTHYVAGQTIYEPADTTIEMYDNVSATKPAVVIAYYLAGKGETQLIKLLPSKADPPKGK